MKLTVCQQKSVDNSLRRGEWAWFSDLWDDQEQEQQQEQEEEQVRTRKKSMVDQWLIYGQSMENQGFYG